MPSSATESNYVAFAVGRGIAPILPILKTVLHDEPKSSFTLFYGSRSSSMTMFREDLADLKDRHMERFNLVHVMTREHQDLDLLNGRITPEKAGQLLQRLAPLEKVDRIFISGPPDMSEGVSRQLESLGFPKSRVTVELSDGPTLEERRANAEAAGAGTCEVTVIVDGRARTFSMERDKETVLDAALRNGIELRYSCKSGVCSTCRCKLTEGKVDMDANYALESYEVERGFVLACQSYPLTNTLTMDFDHNE